MSIDHLLTMLERARALGLTAEQQVLVDAAILAEHGIDRAPPVAVEVRRVEVQPALPLALRSVEAEVRLAMVPLRDAFDRYQRARANSGGSGSAVRLVYAAARQHLESVRRVVAFVAAAVAHCGGMAQLAQRMTRDGLHVRSSDVEAWLTGCRAPDAFEAALLAAIVGQQSTPAIELAERARSVINSYRANLGMMQTRTAYRAQGAKQ